MDFSVIMQVINSALRLTTPIAYVAAGAVVLEKSGISAIAMEGMMLAGAFGAVWGSWVTGLPWIGLLIGMLFSVVVGLIRGFFCINLQANQAVCGIGTNIMMSGLTTVMVKFIWGIDGRSETVTPIADLNLTFLKDVPVLSQLFGALSPLVLLMPFVVAGVWVLLNKTALGMYIVTSGEHPHVLSSLGISVYKTRYTASVIAGLLAGLGGAFLSISNLSFFSMEMTSGRGFMGMAACMFGQWTVGGAMLGSALFGLADAIQIRLQATVEHTQFIQMIPYVTTVFVLFTMGKKRLRAPAQGGKPYVEQDA